MKNNLLIVVMTCLLSYSMLNAQETPKPNLPAPPAPPSSLPAPPKPAVLPDVPTPPQKPDTTIISIGDKQIMIIDNKDKKSGDQKADWEKDLEESMKELKENLKNIKLDMKDSNEDMEQSKKDIEESEKDLEQSRKDIEESKKDIEESQKEMERELKNESEENEENKAPGNNLKFNLNFNKDKNQHKAADIGFLDFDFGINILSGSTPQTLKDDLKLKNWGSWNYVFRFLPTKIYLGTRHLMLMTGLEWRIADFEFKNKVDFDPNKTLAYHTDDNLKQSQFVIQQLQIPLSIYWKSKKIKGLGDVGFGVGGYVGILIHQELETEKSTPNQEIETYEDFGFTEFRYGLSTRLDIGAIKFFANFDLNKLWKNNEFKNIECGIWFDL